MGQEVAHLLISSHRGDEVRRDTPQLESISKAVGKVVKSRVSIRNARWTELQCSLIKLNQASSRSNREPHGLLCHVYYRNITAPSHFEESHHECKMGGYQSRRKERKFER
jgi:hypothetical protein